MGKESTRIYIYAPRRPKCFENHFAQNHHVARGGSRSTVVFSEVSDKRDG